MSTGSPLLEIIACSAEDCARAEAGGADRIELCAAIELGGLTPSIGLLKSSLVRVSIPVMAMIRPRTGGFCYSDDEFEAMLADVRAFRELGAPGVVFGILTADRRVDRERVKQLVEAAEQIQTVFHRAFDATRDQTEALEDLIELGVTRVLTSGGRPTAPEGADRIRELMIRAKGRIEVLPGSGIRAGNVSPFVATTQVTQVHLSAFTSAPDLSMEGVDLTFNFGSVAEATYRQVDPEVVRSVRAALST